MATDKALIERTIETFQPLPINSAEQLRKQAEWKVAQRQLNWEEWLDTRDGWARHYRTLVVVLAKGDDKAMQRAEEQAERNGYPYLLLEYV